MGMFSKFSRWQSTRGDLPVKKTNDLLICNGCYKMYPISKNSPREEQEKKFWDEHKPCRDKKRTMADKAKG